MRFDAEIIAMNLANSLRQGAEESMKRRALPVIDAMLRVGRREDAKAFVKRMPHCVTTALLFEHAESGTPAP